MLAGEGLTHGDRGLLAAGAIGCWPRAPECGLGVQIIKVSEFARGKERVAYKPDGTLDAPLLVSSGYGHGTGFVVMMRGEREQLRIETDRIALALEHGTAQIIVFDDPG